MKQKINGSDLWITLLSLWMIIGTLLYDTVGLGTPSILFTILGGLGLTVLTVRWHSFQREEPPLRIDKSGRIAPAVALLLIALSSLSLGWMWWARTTMSVRSIWQIMPAMWVLLPLSALLCTSILMVMRSRWVGLFSAVAVLPMLLAPTIFFPLGAGFDTHLHEAALRIIATQGVVHPITPYYIGYYVLVILLQRITHIPLVWLHRALVPIVTAIIIGWIAAFYRHRAGRWAVPLILFLFPLAWATEATPQSFALAWLLLTVLLVSEQAPTTIILLTTLASLTIHPLTGIPLAVLIIYRFDIFRRRVLIQGIFSLASVLVLPVLLVALNPALLHTHWSAPILGPFIQLPRQFHPFLDTLFFLAWNKWIIISGLMAVHVRWHPHWWKHEWQKPEIRSLVWASAVTFCSGIALTTIASFHNVIGYETPDFSQRLMVMAFLMLFPIVVASVTAFAEQLRSRCQRVLLFLLFITGVGTIGISLYTLNPIVVEAYQVDKGYSVGIGDIEAVSWIHQDAGVNDYIVLADQAVSAAAVKTFGFEAYRTPKGHEPLFLYPIPTGGELYPNYLRYVYESPTRQTVQEAAKLAQVNTVYVVINQYWKNSLSLIKASHRIADAWRPTSNGTVWIFRFDHLLDHTQ